MKNYYCPLIYFILSAVLMILNLRSYAQTTLFSEDFEGATNQFTLNTTDLSGASAGKNLWIVNDEYNGGSGQSTILCLGFPIPVTYNISNTPAEPAGINNYPYSTNAHITAEFSIAIGISNASFIIADGICIPAESYFMEMTNGISTVGMNDVELSFWWLSEGGTDTYGEVYYSENGGINWTKLTAPISEYRYQSIWTQTTITDPNFNNVSDLRFAFRYVNNLPSGANPDDPSFAVDDIKVVNDIQGPTAAFNVSSDTICEKSCVDFFDLSGGNPASWYWQFQGATPDTSTQPNPISVCYLNSGTYDVTLTVSNANGSNSVTIPDYITVLPAPAPPAITVVNDVLISSVGTAYQWYLNGQIITGATNQYYTPVQPGSYTVIVFDEYGCNSDYSDPVEITGLEIISSWSHLDIMVLNNQLVIVGLSGEKISVELVNISGQTLLQEKVFVQTGELTEFDISGLAEGIYFVHVFDEDHVWTRRILK